MTAIAVDRTHPPSRLVYDDGARRLELRPWTYADADAMLAAVDASAHDLGRFMSWAHAPRTRQGQYELIAQLQASYHAGRDYVVGMFDAGGEVLGGAGVHPRVPLNPRGLEVGYWCHSAHAGKGWATLATRMLVALGFDRFGCDRFQVSHDEANVGSRRVVEKCGFVYEGTARNLLAAPAAELRAAGYAPTGRNRVYALVPEDLSGLAWLEDVRRHTVVYDALGGVA